MKRIATALVTAVLAFALSACSNPSQAGPRTVQPAAAPAPTLQVVAPAAGSRVAAGDVTVKVDTTGLKFVMPNTKKVAGEGHVHFSLDGKPVEMSGKPQYVFKGVAPGSHRLVAELVQNDATPFVPPVKQEISFTAQ